MEREHIQLGPNLLEAIIVRADRIIGSDRTCFLFYNQESNQLECRHKESCTCLFNNGTSNGIIPLDQMATKLKRLFKEKATGGYITTDKDFPTKDKDKPTENSSQILIPLNDSQRRTFGLLVFEFNLQQRFSEEKISTAQSVAELCVLALKKSQKLIDSDRMIRKLKLLSDASNVLLAEFEDKPLPDKFDFIVEKATTILDAELCSLWLSKDGQICLETSYSQEGKALIKKRVARPIKDEPKSGMTGYIAFHKKVFNVYGESLDNHPARNPDNPVDFLDSQKVYSELAFPLLDENKNLLGLLFAYNKLDENRKPIQHAGFSKEFDEPLMKILATKLVISIKNATILKKLRDYELIVESTPDPVVICSKSGEITYMNPGAKELFGDLSGNFVAACYPSDETSEGIEKAREIKRQLYRSKNKKLRNYETKFTSKSGEAIPLSLSASLLLDERGKDAGTIGIAKDLREIKALLATGQSLLETHNIDQILKQITRQCLRISKCKRAYIKLYDEQSETLVFRDLSSRISTEKFPPQSTPKYQGMTGYVFRTQKPYFSNNVLDEPPDRYFTIFDDVKSKIVVPITYIDKETSLARELGVISVDSEELNAFSTNDVYFLTTLANQAAVALENASLIASKNKIITKLRAFDKVQQAATGKNLDVEQILDSVLEAVTEVLGFEYATISMLDRDKKEIGTIKGRNVPAEFLDRAWHSLDSKDIQAWVVRHKTPQYLSGWDERLDKDLYEKYDHQKLVRVIIPIIARGQAWGTLETGYDKSYKSDIEPDEIETLQRIVNLAGMGIEQANLVNQLKQDLALRNELEMQLQALNQASIEILSATTENEAIEDIFTSLKSIGYSKGMLSLVNETTQKIEGRFASGENWKTIVGETKRDLSGKDILAQAVRTKDSILSKSCTKDPACDRAAIRKAGIKSQYVIPLIAKEKAIGTLQIDLTDRQDLVHGEEALLKMRMKVVETFARQVAIAIRNIRDVVTIDRLESNIAETAHEFRSPLHNIMTQVGGLKDLLEESPSNREIDQYVGVIEDEILRAKRQMDNTLLLSDRTREKLEYDFKPGYLQDVIAACESAYRLRALERGLRLIIKDNVKHLPRFEFDRDRMEQALTNLIDNAVKYSHFNQYITISGFDDGANINLEISDRGLGIPESEFGKIFMGFQRSDAKDKMRYIPGTGLGLKICREIIEKHGGKIKVRSIPCSKNPQKINEYQDYMTSFTIILPKLHQEN